MVRAGIAAPGELRAALTTGMLPENVSAALVMIFAARPQDDVRTEWVRGVDAEGKMRGWTDLQLPMDRRVVAAE